MYTVYINNVAVFQRFSFCNNIHTEKSFQNLDKSNHKSDCIDHFPIDLEPNGRPFGSKSIGNRFSDSQCDYFPSLGIVLHPNLRDNRHLCPTWKLSFRLPRVHMPLGLYGVTLRAPLKPLGTIYCP